MSDKGRIKIKIEGNLKKGIPFTVKTILIHPNYNGIMKDILTGKVIPADYIKEGLVSFEGKELFKIDLSPALATNPYFEFPMIANSSGDLKISWTDNHGQKFETTETIELK